MRSVTLILLTSLALALNLSCAKRGLVTKAYDPSFYEVAPRPVEEFSTLNPTFLVYGDNQGCFRLIEDFGKKHNWWTWKQALVPFYQLYWLSNGIVGTVNAARYSADGGKRTRLMMRDVMLDAAKNTRADFILNIGDICIHDGRYPSHWRRFLVENKLQSPLLNSVAYFSTPGNHERTSDVRFGKPNYEVVFGRPPFYTVKFKDAALFVIDSEVICDLYEDMADDVQDSLFAKWYISSDSASPAWLEQELASCDKRFKMIAMHIPPISFGRHFKDWVNEDGRYGNNIPEKRRALLNLFAAENVSIVFAGHEHVYQHNILNFPDVNDEPVSPLHIVVSSGGGVPLRHLPNEQAMDFQQAYFEANGYDVTSQMLAREFHYCEVAVSDTQLVIRTFAVNRNNPESPVCIETIEIPAELNASQ